MARRLLVSVVASVSIVRNSVSIAGAGVKTPSCGITQRLVVFSRSESGLIARAGARLKWSCVLGVIVKPQTEAPGRWTTIEGWLDRIVGHPEPSARAVPLTWRLVAAILGFLAIWRFAILGASLLWGEIGIVNAWPPDIDVMWLFRYSVRWDAGWYLGIVRFGYEYIPERSTSVAFFPLFPLLIEIFDRVLPGSDVFAALVVVHLALMAAVIYVFQIVRLDFDESVAWRTVVFLLVYPGAFFFSAVYAESLLLLGIAGSMFHARRGQWWRAALFGLVASSAKIVGVLMPIPLAIELWRQRGFSRQNPWPVLAVALSGMGTFAYFAYLQIAFGSYSVFFETERQWHRETFSPVFLMGFQRLLGDTSALIYYPANNLPLRTIFLLLDTTLFWIFLIAGVLVWKYIRASYGVLVILLALVPALSGSPQSLNRYLAVLFPAFILLARIRSEPIRQAIVVAFSMGLAITTYLFIQGYWAG